MSAESPENERLAYLLGRVALRDRAAFKELYDLTNRYLFRVALRRVNSRERAEDVLQEAYLEVWRKGANFSAGTSRAMTWLITIVDARAIDVHRRTARDYRFVVAADLEDEQLEAHLSPQVEVESFRDNFGMDVSARLTECFRRLSREQRLAIVGIRIRGMTIDEAARCFRVPRQTAAAWVRRGIQRLSECLGHESSGSAA